MQIDNRVTGTTRFAGLLGNPVEHSVSPQLHNTISTYLNVDFVYIPFKVEKEDLENAVKGLRALNVVGFNVTTPFKKDIIKYLDDTTKQALLMGAVNTVKNIDGRLYGYNTDAEGFARSFKEETGTGLKGKKILIIGAGGAARAVAVKAAIDGADSIYISARTKSKADDIASILNDHFTCDSKSYALADEQTARIFNECDVIINTTSAGMKPQLGISPLDGTGCRFSEGQIVYDVIYNPPLTKFLSDAAAAGCKTVNGIGMLFYQGISAYEIWTGIKVPPEMLKELYESFKGILKA